MLILCEGVRFSWDFYQCHSRKAFMYRGWLRQPQDRDERTIWEGGRIYRNHRKIGEQRGSVIKPVMDCYTMANSKNVMYVCWFEWYTFPPKDVSCMNVRMSEKVQTGLKRRKRNGFLSLHSSYHPQYPLHNLYETGLSSASSIGIIWGIKPGAILVQM